jgi:Sulfotransferase family
MLDFVVIGSQKCGTTWLFDKLKMHPRLYFPMGKEGNHWNHRFYMGDPYRSIYHAAMNGPVVELSCYVCGEMTPEYAIMSLEQIQNLKKHHPDVHLFLMVRNPIQRAWSAIKMTYKYHKLDLSSLTDERIIQAITTGKTAELGRYDVMIQNWLAVFAPSQLHILFFDDLSTRYRDILSKCCSVVGVESGFFEQIPDAVLAAPSLTGSRHPLKANIYNSCIEFYRPAVQFLAEYTGRPLNHWIQPVDQS